ncbi:type II toxin-antitoxin system VapC family toxin [Persicitalea sp.]|uniref:type II toxin-antitoxin system VapC family toxin n=1 Tax=Persicitalea sp. TaxID=3100273 RepID=UPI00359441AA
MVDSNAAIDYLNAKLPPAGMDLMDSLVDDVSVITVITQIEILGFDAPPEDEAVTHDFVNSSFIIALDPNIIKKTIEIRKFHKIKTPDAIIAASALCFDLTLVTRNTADFLKIYGLKLLNPHSVES